MKLASRFSLKGAYKIKTFKHHWLADVLPKKTYLAILKSGILGNLLLRESAHNNLIMLGTNTGLNLLLQQMGGNDTYPIEIDSAKIGDGTTPPVSADTDLENAILSDIDRSTVTIGTDTLVTEWFMTDTDLADGTYTELGLFCGTQIFCRSLIDPSHTKADNEDTLIEYTITAFNT